jgi:hypothetical protein
MSWKVRLRTLEAVVFPQPDEPDEPGAGLAALLAYAREHPAAAHEPQDKPRQHLCYVYASLSRLDFRDLLEKGIVVFEGFTSFLAVKKPTALMMHWWNGGRGGVCTGGLRPGRQWLGPVVGGSAAVGRGSPLGPLCLLALGLGGGHLTIPAGCKGNHGTSHS